MEVIAWTVGGIAAIGYICYRISKVRFCLHHDGTALQEQAEQKGLKQ